MCSPVICGNIRWDWLAIWKDNEHTMISQLPRKFEVESIPRLCCAEALDTTLIQKWLWQEIDHDHIIEIEINDQNLNGFSPTVKDLDPIPHLLFRSVVRLQHSTIHNTRDTRFAIWINDSYYDAGKLTKRLQIWRMINVGRMMLRNQQHDTCLMFPCPLLWLHGDMRMRTRVC